jgi:hypothetical protein
VEFFAREAHFQSAAVGTEPPTAGRIALPTIYRQFTEERLLIEKNGKYIQDSLQG